MNIFRPLLCFLSGLAVFSQISCNDPTVIGSDLFTGDLLDITFTDTVTLRAGTILDDSVLTFSPVVFGSDIRSSLFGDFQDPVFGRVTSTVYFQVSPGAQVPDFVGAELDSILLLLPYNADKSYGNLNEFFHMEVSQLDEQLNVDSFYFSTQSFKVRNPGLGFMQFVPRLADSTSAYEPEEKNLVKYAPHLRVPLSEDFGNFLLTTDPDNFLRDSSFNTLLAGFQLRPAITTSGMLSFDMRNAVAGLKIYYHQDTLYQSYTFPILSTDVVTMNIAHDYTGAFAEPFIRQPAQVADSLLFIQGASGTDIVVDIPYASALKGYIVNKAELEMKILRMPFDGDIYGFADQLVAFERTDDSFFIFIQDLQFALNRLGNSFGLLFGGKVVSDNTYRINISSQYQDIISGAADNRLVLSVHNKVQKASRSVIAGTSHSMYPMKLKLSLTKY